MDNDQKKIDQQSQEGEKPQKVFISGSSRKSKKKKMSPLMIVILILLLGVMCFSGYKIVDQLLVYKRGQDAYNELRNQVIGEAFQPAKLISTTAWTVPASEPPSLEPLPETEMADSQAHSTDSGNRPSPTRDLRGDITYDDIGSYAKNSQILPFFPVDFGKLKGQNADTVAWLYGMDGIVNYPVVQGRDNDYYVHRLLDGREQFCGTLFVDCRNDFMQDDVTYIYGHKMKDGTMFGHFGLYDTYQYYQSHPAFRLFTPEATYDLQVITCVYTSINEPIIPNYANEQEFNRAMDNIRRRGQFRTAVDVEYGDHLVCLFTCAYYIENGRMFVICKAVKVAEN